LDELSEIMAISTSFQRSRKNSNPKIARFPPSVFTSKPQSKKIEVDPKFFVLRAKGKELMLKMYDTSADALAMLAILKSK